MDILKNFKKMQKTIGVLGPLVKKHGPVVCDVILALESIGLFKLPKYVHNVLEALDSDDDCLIKDEKVVGKAIEKMEEVAKTDKKGKEKLNFVVDALVKDTDLPQVKEEDSNKVVDVIETIFSITKLF